tara:strand:- start:2219 stop:3025 length:807 start_codon:yes stop_codon:yes gene_type:complete
MAINSRVKLIEYCLRRLGTPVIDVNLDGLATYPDGTTNSTNPYTNASADSQIQDRIDDALQFFQDYHYDAIKKTYVKHKVTASDISNKYIAITNPDTYTGIVNIFPFEADTSTSSLTSLKYQLSLNELYDMSNVSLTHYVMTQQHLNLIQSIFVGTKPFEFNRHEDKLWIYMDWENDIKEDDYLIVEAYQIIDPETYTEVYNDMWLKRYATALLKRQWGENLSKYDGITLPGGISYNGTGILDSAIGEIETLEAEMKERDIMPHFLVG